MKLEIKHLAPYLPYGLTVLSKPHLVTYGEQVPLEVNGIAYSDSSNPPDWQYEFIVNDELMFAMINEKKHFKPILRPLSDLTEDKFKNVIFKLQKVNNDVTMLFVDFDYKELSVWEYEFLLENHFDVFGLIEKDLAIDMNSLKSEAI